MPAVSLALALACPNCDQEVPEEAQYCHLCGAVLVEHPQRPPAQPLVYGELWRRFFACMIDSAIVTAIVIPSALVLTWILEVLSGWEIIDREGARFAAGMGAVVFYLVADWVYNARQMSSRRQATLGKRWMQLKITTLEGEPISFGQATGRHFAKFLSTFALFVGFFIAAFSKRRQALHDMVAGTLVVKGRR